MPLIQFEKLIKHYTNSFTLGPVDLSIRQGQVVGLLGPNGSGKTTLLKILLGITSRTCGTIKVHGSTNFKEIRKKSSVVLEKSGFFNDFTAKKNLEIFYRYYSEEDYNFNNLLNQFNLPIDKKLSSYSKGMLQRLNIAKSLLLEKELYIYDEPFSGLDIEGISFFRKLILNLKDKNKTIIIASHIISELEKYCTSFIILSEGKIVNHNAKDNLIKQFGSIEDAYLQC